MSDSKHGKLAHGGEVRAGRLSNNSIEAEQEYIRTVYGRLDGLIREKERQLAVTRAAVPQGTHQNRSERDAFVRMYEDRLAQLRSVEDKLIFGRIDMDAGPTHYIGRIGLSTEELEQLLIDWRAPEAGAFYQATAKDRLGVKRRRHLMIADRNVQGLEDEILDPELLKHLSDGGEGIQGAAALLAAVNAKRTGRMGDIVATIQSEQDAIIRAPLQGALVVQGGPGTGKTAVALHRAAYILYTHRNRLSSAGVLVVGPSPGFMRYIERVLPALGESGVVMSSLGALYPGVTAAVDTDKKVAEIKGRDLWQEIIASAVRNRQRIPEKARTISIDGQEILLTPEQVRRARQAARNSGKPYNQARLTFIRILLKELTEAVRERIRSNASAMNTHDLSYVTEEVRSSKEVRVALNLAWMPMTAQGLLTELFTVEAVLAKAARGLLTAEEQRLVRQEFARRNPGVTVAQVLRKDSVCLQWTESEVPLLDEAAEHLGALHEENNTSAAMQQTNEHNARRALDNMSAAMAGFGVDGVLTAQQLVSFNEASAPSGTLAQQAANDRAWAYGHIVVDEAQELSRMQWRMLVRRCPLKSMTLVGDVAQTSAAAGAQSWDTALEPVFGPRGERWRVEELTVNYRTPAQIARAAVAVADELGAAITAPAAVREGRWGPCITHVPAARLADAVADAAAQELDIIGGGLLAVIATGNRRKELEEQLRNRYGEKVGQGSGSLKQPIVVATPQETKGLEYDAVIVVEPADIIDGAEGRPGDLYVAMTRPTQRLHCVGARPMPAGLEPEKQV